MWLELLCLVMGIIILLLIIKICLLHKAAREIHEGFSEKLTHDTNGLISISTSDPCMRKLASEINSELRLLQAQRHKYITGDAELKTAVTNISHDLRTPLTAICGYLELMEQEEKSENVEKYLAAIKNRTEALKSLTEELFRYSLILSDSEELELETVDLNSVLEESLAGMYAAFKSRGITPKIEMPAAHVLCNGNKEALGRVFNNVLSNALKYSDGDLEVKLSEDGCVAFSNSASQLTEVEVEKLFDRFYTVENARNSTGLGLSIARLLLEKMNGTIRAEYEGEKLNIYIRLRKERLC